MVEKVTSGAIYLPFTGPQLVGARWPLTHTGSVQVFGMEIWRLSQLVMGVTVFRTEGAVYKQGRIIKEKIREIRGQGPAVYSFRRALGASRSSDSQS